MKLDRFHMFTLSTGKLFGEATFSIRGIESKFKVSEATLTEIFNLVRNDVGAEVDKFIDDLRAEIAIAAGDES